RDPEVSAGGTPFFVFQAETEPVVSGAQRGKSRHRAESPGSPNTEAIGRGDESKAKPPTPTRVTFTYSRERRRYKFGAITEDAAVPEREIGVSPSLIEKINDRLVSESDPDEQAECGLQLGINLVPRELRGRMMSDAPLVMLLDPDSSRIHWEMVAQ